MSKASAARTSAVSPIPELRKRNSGEPSGFVAFYMGLMRFADAKGIPVAIPNRTGAEDEAQAAEKPSLRLVTVQETGEDIEE